MVVVVVVCFFGKTMLFVEVEAGAAYRKRLILAYSKPDYLPRVFCFSSNFQIKLF